jgi:hypothetical protein
MLPEFLESADALLRLWSDLKGFIERTRRLIIQYLVLVFTLIFVAWCINIFVSRQAVLWVLLLAIPTLLFFLARKELLISILIGRLLLVPADPSASWWQAAVRHAKAVADILSSITFASIWPILILTYLDFSSSPTNFWQVFAALIMLCSLDAYTHGSSGKVLKFFVYATPSKLATQLMMTATKLAGGESLFGIL